MDDVRRFWNVPDMAGDEELLTGQVNSMRIPFPIPSLPLLIIVLFLFQIIIITSYVADTNNHHFKCFRL